MQASLCTHAAWPPVTQRLDTCPYRLTVARHPGYTSGRWPGGILSGWYAADRRVGRVVERGGLENRYRVTPYRGFESLTLRHSAAAANSTLERWPSGLRRSPAKGV